MIVGRHEKSEPPTFNGGTIEIPQNKKGSPREWYHNNFQKAIL